MNVYRYFQAGLAAAALGLAGCAAGPGGDPIYVPVGGPSQAPKPPQTTTSGQEDPRVWRKSEQPEVQAPEPEQPQSSAPSYSAAGDNLSPAALSLVREADRLLAQNNPSAAVAQLERAQRISPRSPAVYFKLSEAYVAMNQLGNAEQFTLKGLSLAGSDARMQRAGWLLLADIRRARGNVAGADQAEARAAAL